MPKVLGLTPGRNAPSSRFRIRQYKAELEKHNYNLNESYSPIPYDFKLPGILGKVRQRYIFPLSAGLLLTKIISRIPQISKSYNYDLVWLNRPLIDNIFLEKLLHKPLIFDVDDAIWLNGAKHCKKIAEYSDFIFAGNSFIAEWFQQYNKNIEIIPTVIDTNKFKPSDQKKNDFFNIVWTGSLQTEHYLLSIENNLFRFINDHKDVKLTIVSDKIPNFKFIQPNQIIFNKWNSEIEALALQQANVGIMPLNNTEWEKGKCSFKMLQYMATGIPVIISPIGMNAEVFSKGDIGFAANKDDDWINALEFLYKNQAKVEVLGNNGRNIVLEEYSIQPVSRKIIKVFNKFSNNPN
jgi:glycosyltransferase involved in cell wall biosynthesis